MMWDGRDTQKDRWTDCTVHYNKVPAEHGPDK